VRVASQDHSSNNRFELAYRTGLPKIGWCAKAVCGNLNMQKNPALPPDLRIPVIDEKYSVSKRVRTKDFIVEKKWVTKTVSIPVSVKYEEIFVDGKRFGSGIESVLSSIKGSIKRETETEKEKKRKAKLNKGQAVPLSKNDVKLREILPLYGEEVIINKRMRQVGEAVIAKRKVTERKKVSINVKGERIIARHPDGTEEYIQEKPFTAQPAKFYTSAV
jgi:stress response protein YsnF